MEIFISQNIFLIWHLDWIIKLCVLVRDLWLIPINSLVIFACYLLDKSHRCRISSYFLRVRRLSSRNLKWPCNQKLMKGCVWNIKIWTPTKMCKNAYLAELQTFVHFIASLHQFLCVAIKDGVSFIQYALIGRCRGDLQSLTLSGNEAPKSFLGHKKQSLIKTWTNEIVQNNRHPETSLSSTVWVCIARMYGVLYVE